MVFKLIPAMITVLYNEKNCEIIIVIWRSETNHASVAQQQRNAD